MFWTNYLSYCSQMNKAPSAVAKDLGITSGTVTGWKQGKIPSQKSLQKIADYFGVTVWDLLGDKIPVIDVRSFDNFELREELRNNPAFRILYDTLENATDADMLEAAATIARRTEEGEKE